MNEKPYELLDLLTGEIVKDSQRKRLAEKIGAKASDISNHNQEKSIHVINRYVSPNCDLIYTLVDYDNGEEFRCITPTTFCLYFGVEPTTKIRTAICHLKNKRMTSYSFLGRIFYLKGNKPERIGARGGITEAVKKQKGEWKERRKIRRSIQVRIIDILKSRGIMKSKKTEEFLGCSVDFFIQYVESLFTEGMTWGNRGRDHLNGFKSWNLDHIIPVNTFDLTKESERLKCFNFKNLRPLWEVDNLSRPKDGSDINKLDFPDLF